LSKPAETGTSGPETDFETSWPVTSHHATFPAHPRAYCQDSDESEQGCVASREAKVRRIAGPLLNDGITYQSRVGLPSARQPLVPFQSYLPNLQSHAAVTTPYPSHYVVGNRAGGLEELPHGTSSWPWFTGNAIVTQGFSAPFYSNSSCLFPYVDHSSATVPLVATSAPHHHLPARPAIHQNTSVAPTLDVTPDFQPVANDTETREFKHRYHCRRCGKLKRGHVCKVRRKGKRLTFPKRAKFAAPCE
jgi:hypothetical protein